MPELDDLLREAVTRRSDDYEPSADLPDRIDARVRAHRRRRQVVAGALASVAAAAAIAAVALLDLDRSDREKVQVVDSSTSSSSSSSTTSTTTGPAVSRLTLLSPLTRAGIGTITAGMTVEEAEAAAGTTIEVSDPGGSTECREGHIAGLDTVFEILIEPGAGGGVVKAVIGPVTPTAEGAIVGQRRAELLAALGQPTRSEPADPDWGDGTEELLVFEADGVAYSAVLTGDFVMALYSGDPSWVVHPSGCPT